MRVNNWIIAAMVVLKLDEFLNLFLKRIGRWAFGGTVAEGRNRSGTWSVATSPFFHSPSQFSPPQQLIFLLSSVLLG
jgi:hypothetical protein